MEEQYTFNGTPKQFARDVDELYDSRNKRGQPTNYSAAGYTAHRPVVVFLSKPALPPRSDWIVIGKVTTRYEGQATLLLVQLYDEYADEARAAWEQLRNHLQALEWRIQPADAPPPTDAIFAELYRRRAGGEKVTLRQMAQKYEYNESYLSRMKSEYDHRTGRKRKRR